jgi:membrane protein implicated in regulation of membrane protease activity
MIIALILFAVFALVMAFCLASGNMIIAFILLAALVLVMAFCLAKAASMERPKDKHRN